MTDHKGKLSPLLKQATGITAAKGEGAYIVDTDGRRYLDFTSGIGVTSTGHCHPKVVEAAQKQGGSSPGSTIPVTGVHRPSSARLTSSTSSAPAAPRTTMTVTPMSHSSAWPTCLRNS